MLLKGTKQPVLLFVDNARPVVRDNITNAGPITTMMGPGIFTGACDDCQSNSSPFNGVDPLGVCSSDTQNPMNSTPNCSKDSVFQGGNVNQSVQQCKSCNNPWSNCKCEQTKGCVSKPLVPCVDNFVPGKPPCDGYPNVNQVVNNSSGSYLPQQNNQSGPMITPSVAPTPFTNLPPRKETFVVGKNAPSEPTPVALMTPPEKTLSIAPSNGTAPTPTPFANLPPRKETFIVGKNTPPVSQTSTPASTPSPMIPASVTPAPASESSTPVSQVPTPFANLPPKTRETFIVGKSKPEDLVESPMAAPSASAPHTPSPATPATPVSRSSPPRSHVKRNLRISVIDKSKHPNKERIVGTDYCFAVKGKDGQTHSGGIVKLNRGQEYNISLDNPTGGKFTLFFTYDSLGGDKGGWSTDSDWEPSIVPGTPEVTSESPATLFIDNDMPSMFYYQAKEVTGMGGVIMVR